MIQNLDQASKYTWGCCQTGEAGMNMFHMRDAATEKALNVMATISSQNNTQKSPKMKTDISGQDYIG